MKLKERIKNGGFWVSLISSVFLILGAFGIEIAGETADAVINAVCSALVVLGIASNPTKGTWYLDEKCESADGASESDVTATEEVAKTETQENNVT
ncbi:MAG: holin [Clostridiales bacterium]|nr:holin [Clostridiales bacterium]